MTFTLLAADMDAGLLAAGTASRSLAVGNAVIAIDPAVGAVASQAWTNRALRARMLEAMAAGHDPDTVMSMVPVWDTDTELRQVAALLPNGIGAARTGTETSPWAGAVVQPGLVALGNLLTGPEVLDAVVTAFTANAGVPGAAATTPTALARCVVGALRAGEAAGGDRRGRQSAAIVVARMQPHRQHPPELDVDLRVDDDPDPLGELTRMLAGLA